MKRGAVVFAAAALAAGGVYLWTALRMPRGTVGYPGPGFYPVLVGVFLVVTAAWCLVQDLRRVEHAAAAEAADAAGPAHAPSRKTVQLVALTAGYILLLAPVGYPIAMCAFLVLAIRIFGYRRWLRTVAIAAVITAVSWVSFVHWLKVPLPMGPLADLLG